MFRRFETVAARYPDVIAISNEVTSLTFQQLLAQAHAFRAALEAASAAGPRRVLLAVSGGPAFAALQLGTLAAACVLAAIPDKSTEREARAALSLFEPDIVVVDSRDAQAAVVAALPPSATLVELSANVDDALLRLALPAGASRAGLPPEARMVQFTSGSTAAPKGIVLSEGNLLANLEANAAHLEAFRGDAVFCPIPQSHAMGNAVVLEHLLHGSPVHVANQFLPSADVERLKQYACRAVLASPNYFKLLLRLRFLTAATLPLLRSFTIGTSSVEPALVHDLHAAYPEATVHCRYGLSESVGALARLDLRRGEPFELGLVGHPVPGVEVRSAPVDVETTELWARGPCVGMSELVSPGLCRPLADSDGFLHTGDVGQIAADGSLRISGRISTFLKVGGQRVNPFEVEATLRDFPGIQEAVVVGVLDAMAGQRLVACIEPLPGESLDDTRALLAHCRSELSAYKVPQRFVVMAALPRTAAGKPDRRALLASASSA